jgi:hypothetical protein
MKPGSLIAGGGAIMRAAQKVWIEWGAEARSVSPLCGGESDFDGLVEQREGQTSEIAREGNNPNAAPFPSLAKSNVWLRQFVDFAFSPASGRDKDRPPPRLHSPLVEEGGRGKRGRMRGACGGAGQPLIRYPSGATHRGRVTCLDPSFGPHKGGRSSGSVRGTRCLRQLPPVRTLPMIHRIIGSALGADRFLTPRLSAPR